MKARSSVSSGFIWSVEARFAPPPAREPGEVDLDSISPETIEWERTYALFVHLSLLLVHAAIPVIPALVMWLIKRDRSLFVDDHGKEAINFQLTLLIYALAIVPIGILTCGVGYALIAPLYVLGIVGMILGARAAARGRFFRAPMCLRLVG